MKHRRVGKRVALIACSLLLLALVCNLALEMGHAGHCDHPQTCSVCRQIDAVRSLLEQLALALALPLSRMLAPNAGRASHGARPRIPLCLTPVTLSVRMNN